MGKGFIIYESLGLWEFNRCVCKGIKYFLYIYNGDSVFQLIDNALLYCVTVLLLAIEAMSNMTMYIFNCEI